MELFMAMTERIRFIRTPSSTSYVSFSIALPICFLILCYAMNLFRRNSKTPTTQTSPPEINRYAHDLKQAQAMKRRGNSTEFTQSEGRGVSDQSVLQALDGLERSETLKRNGDLRLALKESEQSLNVLIQYLKSPQISPKISKDVLRSTVESALSDAEEMKSQLQSQTKKKSSSTSPTALTALIHKKLSISPKSSSISSPKSASSTPTSQTSRGRPQTIFNNQDPIVQLVKSELYVDPSQLAQAATWDDIAGLRIAKQSLQEAAILPLIRPDLFTGLRKPQNLLLYGPPGTGKTLLVKAVAKESSSLLFVCTASSLTSKWHGEGEKILKKLFEIARAAAPSILFVDEVDALLSARKSEGEHEASRRFKTEFMTQVDGITSPSQSSVEGNLLVIACTNCPWDIDSAVLRRFPRRIYIDLPDSSTRSVLLDNLLKKAGSHSLSKSQQQKVVDRLEGFSGSDITSIASEASFGPLRSLGSMRQIQNAKTNDIRPISYKDFKQALDQATKSTSQDLLVRYDQWRKDQGS